MNLKSAYNVIKDEIKHFISMENNNPYEYIYTINESGE